MASGALTVEQLRSERIRQERDWYLSEEGFLDFARDCGAAPDAQYEPHGRLAHVVLRWMGVADPDLPERTLYRHKLVLWPRGSFKTQVFGVAYVAWLIAKDPNVRILYASETNHQAVKPVEIIKDIISSPWFCEKFGDHRGADWRTGTFTSALRTAHHLKDPTLLAAGVGEVQTGAHWDFSLLDDVCSQKNTQTPQGIDKLWNWFGEMKAQLDPGCRLLILGTLHHFSDIYCRIQKDDALRSMFDISVHAWRDPPGDPDDGIEGKLFFPNRLTPAFVREQKLFLTPRLFAHFYLNSPHSDSDQLFKVEYFRTVADGAIPKNVWGYIFTDFAFTTDDTDGEPDRTCFWVVVLDPNRVAWVVDFRVGRWKPSDSVRLACELWEHWSGSYEMKGMCVEKTTHAELLSSLFEEVRRHAFVRPRFILIEGRSQEVKNMRIEAAEPRFRRGDIYFSESVRAKTHAWKAMVSEMTEWPFSGHDDIPDAISDIDKKNKDGRLYCVAPPVGWRPQAAHPTKPQMVDGAPNPDYPHPAREAVRRDQQRTSAWPWNGTEQGQPGSFWKRPR